MESFRRVVLPVALVVMAAARAASADESATADALFRAGRSAMQRGDYTEAVSRFAESQRVEPAPGTLLNLAIAEEKLGRVSSAWEHARSAAAALPPSDGRRKVAQELFERLDGQVPRLVLRSKDLPHDVSVKLDATELKSASFGVPLPVDPGVHRVTVEAPGYEARTFEIVAKSGATSEEVIGLGARLPTPPTPPSDSSAMTSSVPSSPLRTVGWVSIGVGAAAAVTGTVFGVMTMNRNDVVEARCTPDCDGVGFDAANAGRTYSTVSTATFIGAGVFVLGGILMVLLAPHGTTKNDRPRAMLTF